MKPGEVLDRWRVVRAVAQGGVSEVHLAEEVSGGELVAVKILRPDLELDGAEARSLIEEARLLDLVPTSSGLVSLVDGGCHGDGRPYLVLSWAPRGSLSDRLGAGVGRDPWAVGRIVRTLAGAVGELHTAGVVHCDLHPGNLLVIPATTTVSDPLGPDVGPRLLESDEDLLLCDLGVALEGARPRPPRCFGTPRFRAPEQIDPQGEIGPFTDVYGATMVLWSLVSGDSPPWPGEVSGHLGMMPGHWRGVMARGLHPEGARRQQSIGRWCEEVSEALDQDLERIET